MMSVAKLPAAGDVLSKSKRHLSEGTYVARVVDLRNTRMLAKVPKYTQTAVPSAQACKLNPLCHPIGSTGRDQGSQTIPIAAHQGEDAPWPFIPRRSHLAKNKRTLSNPASRLVIRPSTSSLDRPEPAA